MYRVLLWVISIIMLIINDVPVIGSLNKEEDKESGVVIGSIRSKTCSFPRVCFISRNYRINFHFSKDLYTI